MLVLDTHAVVWWAGDPASLSTRAASRLDRAERLGVPAIVFWEVALLTRRRKLDLGMPVRDWAASLGAIPRIESLPLTADIALLADELEMQPDPADRFIVATALVHDAPLVTKDRLLRSLRFVQTIW